VAVAYGAVTSGRGQHQERTANADETTVAVVAHALLGSMAVISGAAETLEEAWTQLTAANRKALLAMIGAQSAHVSGLLRDLIRGLPQEPIRELELLGPESWLSPEPGEAVEAEEGQIGG
jgi:signal transduction histidine kinase